MTQNAKDIHEKLHAWLDMLDPVVDLEDVSSDQMTLALAAFSVVIGRLAEALVARRLEEHDRDRT